LAPPLAAGPDGTGVKTASPRAWSWAALMHRAFDQPIDYTRYQ
jgi:hypothetical protein